MPSRILFLPMLCLIFSPIRAEVDPEVHTICLKAKDYAGCVKMMPLIKPKRTTQNKVNSIHSKPSYSNQESIKLKPIAPIRPITVAVRQVKDRSGAPWFKSTFPEKLANVLSTELTSTGHFTVLERNTEAMSELRKELGMSGINPNTASRKNNLNQAKYIILASLTDFEESSSGGDAKTIGYGGFKVGGGKKVSSFYVSFDLKVVNTSTGTIAYSRTIEGNASKESKSKAFAGTIRGVSLGKSESKAEGVNKTRVIRSAMQEIASYLDCVLYLKDECIEVYKAKDQQRREANDSLDMF